MPIAPNCHMCGQQLQDFGALVFSPPDHYEDCHKYHVCRICWDEVQKALDGNGWISIEESLPLDDFADNKRIITDVLVCGAWDEDEPPPNAYTQIVSFAGDLGWTYYNHYGKPWPYADKITHWMPLPEPHPNAGKRRSSLSRRQGTIGYASRIAAHRALELRKFAECVAPDEDSPPSLIELRAAMEHMAFELEQRHSQLKIEEAAADGQEKDAPDE